MKRIFLAALLSATLAGPAFAQAQLPLDAPIPSDFKDRLSRRLRPSLECAKMERVVGYWGFMKDGVIQVSSSRPASFTAVPALTKVTLASGKPSYEGVLSRSNELAVAMPVIGISWASNQKGQVTITDSASSSPAATRPIPTGATFPKRRTAGDGYSSTRPRSTSSRPRC